MSKAKAKYLIRKLKNLSKLKTGIKMKKTRKHFSSVRQRADADLLTLCWELAGMPDQVVVFQSAYWDTFRRAISINPTDLWIYLFYFFLNHTPVSMFAWVNWKPSQLASSLLSNIEHPMCVEWPPGPPVPVKLCWNTPGHAFLPELRACFSVWRANLGRECGIWRSPFGVTLKIRTC